MYSGRSEVEDSAVAGRLVWGVVENYTMRQNKRAKARRRGSILPSRVVSAGRLDAVTAGKGATQRHGTHRGASIGRRQSPLSDLQPRPELCRLVPAGAGAASLTAPHRAEPGEA